MTTNLKPLTSQSSKLEELAFLKGVQQLAGENTYMRGLVSNKLIDWFEQQIRNDFPGDIMEAYEGEQRDSNRKSSDLQNANHLLEVSEIAKNNLESRVEVMKDTIETQRKQREEGDRFYESKIAGLEQTNSELHIEICQLQDSAEQNDAIYKMNLDEKNLEIMALKAKLYDLQNSK